MGDSCNLPCYNCGSIGLTDGFDGFFYCLQCGSQADDIIDTGVADEDLAIRDTGVAGGPIYSQTHTRRRNPAVMKVEPLSQSQPQDLFGTAQSEFWDSLNVKEEPYDNEARKDDDVVMMNDGVGPTGPEDFGSVGVLPGAPSFEEYADEVRMRYVMGLQLMIELQCEVLVKEFKACPVICGLAASIWLRFVTATRVFDEDWAFETIQDSESQYQDPENIRPISSRHKAEPHNLYGQRVVTIWVKYLRKKISLSCTLAVSFLACHVAREAILPTDIMKWSLEGKLPYFAAFIDIENRIGKTSRACPISSKHMYCPSRIPSLQKLESLAASIAHTIGLNLPPVNFHSIACRYLDKLALPVDKILSHACRIYEWSMPPDLWLSTNELRLPSRVCVMSILIIAMRILYNLHGFGEWEKSLSNNCASSFPPNQKRHSSPANNFSNMQADSETRPEFTSHNVDNPSVSTKYSHRHKPELTAIEFLHKIEARYHEIAETYEYSKDLPSYLQHSKDVAFAGLESLFEDHEEEKMIEQFWNYYQNEKDSEQTEDVDQNAASNQKRLREGSNDRLSNKSKKPKSEDRVSGESSNNRTESNSSQQRHSSKSSEHGDDEELSSEDKASTPTSINGAIRRLKLDMEEKRFCYIPPRVNPKRFDYLHYSRKIDEEDVLQVFFEERKLNGDFISKASDILWQREVLKFEDANDDRFTDTSQQVLVVENDDDGGFLKLASTQAWISGGNSAPINKKAGNKAAISYAVGALSRIGVRSEDIKNAFEKSVKGSGIALSSPRLVIPAAIYALWIISHKYLANHFFDFQLTPAMLGMFVYKAAALVQVYRDNENLKLDFPEN